MATIISTTFYFSIQIFKATENIPFFSDLSGHIEINAFVMILAIQQIERFRKARLFHIQVLRLCCIKIGNSSIHVIPFIFHANFLLCHFHRIQDFTIIFILWLENRYASRCRFGIGTIERQIFIWLIRNTESRGELVILDFILRFLSSVIPMTTSAGR